MKKRWKVISAVVVALFLLTLVAVPVLAQTTVTRDIADQTLAPGGSTNVTVTINNAQLQALGLDEDPPAGWPVAEVDNGGGAYQATHIEWAWVPSAAAGTITVIYNLTVPLGTADGTYDIVGTLVSGEGTVAIGGESQITVSGAPVATTATRDIADQTLTPGGSTNVTVTINNAQLQALGLDEDPPAGWSVAEVDNGGGAYQATHIEWAWVPSAAAGTITVIYNLTVPLGTADGTYDIAGTLVSGEGTVAIGGESQIMVSGVPVATTAIRDIADQTLASGESTNVTVTINNAQLQGLGLDEDPPADWPVAEVDNGGGAYQATHIEWAWVPSAAAGTITVIYNLTVPLGTADGTYDIAGTLLSGEGTVAVGGETTITVAVPGPVVFDETFTNTLAEDEREYICLIPGGATDLDIELTATADIDLGLYDGDTFVIGWGGEIDSSGATTGTYEGDTFAYSGWDGGDEDITAVGPLGRDYSLEVFGYEAGDYVVTVSYIIPVDVDVTPPVIDIIITGASPVSLGNPVTITVSASDPSGVEYILFDVLSDVVDVASAYGTGGEVTLIFTPQATGTYTVEAWAEDTVGNITPETAPETATFEVE